MVGMCGLMGNERRGGGHEGLSGDKKELECFPKESRVPQECSLSRRVKCLNC